MAGGIRDYVSDRVFDGVRPLPANRAASMVARMNALVVLRNTDADEAGDYRVAPRIDVLSGKWSGWKITDIDPSDLD